MPRIDISKPPLAIGRMPSDRRLIYKPYNLARQIYREKGNFVSCLRFVRLLAIAANST